MYKLVGPLLIFSLLLAIGGCQSASSSGIDLTLTQTPATVQAAFAQNYPGSVIKQITRARRGNQDYYTFKFAGIDGKDRTVQLNEAGDEIEHQ